MSVNKLRIKHRRSISFTNISNQVLQNINDYEVLGLYCYLLSLPEDWEFHKSHLRKHGQIGINKIDKMLNALQQLGLVEQLQKRGIDGKYSGWDLIVDDGTNFKMNKNSKLSTEKHENAAPFNENRSMKTVAPFRDTTYNKDTNNKKNKLNISCASGDAPSRFDDFWNAYPVKKNKLQAKKAWVKHKLDGEVDKIIEAVIMFKTMDREWLSGFIPHAATFLNGKRWEDEVIPPSAQSKPQSTAKATKPTMEFPDKDTLSEALVYAVHYKQFSHPIVFLLLEKIGSWAIRNDKAYDLKMKINQSYNDVCNEYAGNQTLVHDRIAYFKEHDSFMPKEFFPGSNSMAQVLRSNFVGSSDNRI